MRTFAEVYYVTVCTRHSDVYITSIGGGTEHITYIYIFIYRNKVCEYSNRVCCKIQRTKDPEPIDDRSKKMRLSFHQACLKTLLR